LTEGEEILRNGAVGHNHLWFYVHAMQACVNNGEWDEATRYAESLQTYTQTERLPWADFFIDWGRALAAHGRHPQNHVMCELRRLRDEAERFGMRTALPSIERALAVA
jgi:hypothetical protein